MPSRTPTCHPRPAICVSHPPYFRAHCFKRNGWRSSLYVYVSLSFVCWHAKFDAYMPPASRILLPWLLSTRLPLSLMPLSTQRLYDFHTRSSTARPSLRSGHYIPSGLASYAPVFGSLPTNVVTRPIPSPSLSIILSAGSCTLRTYFHRSSFPSGSLTVHQSRSSIPLLAYHTWETPRFHRAPNSGSGLRPQDSFLPRPSSLRFCPRGSSGCFRQQEGYE